MYENGVASWDRDPRSAANVSEMQRRGYTPDTCASLVIGPSAVTSQSTSSSDTRVDDTTQRVLPSTLSNGSAIPLQRHGGIFVVPVTINNAITLGFALDSGAADVSVPADVFLTLIRTGTIGNADFLGSEHYMMADGTVVPSATFRIRKLKIGDRQVENVRGSVSSVKGMLLLGQSFLGRFKSWSIDNQRRMLLLD